MSGLRIIAQAHNSLAGEFSVMGYIIAGHDGERRKSAITTAFKGCYEKARCCFRLINLGDVGLDIWVA